jgi:hypothetical protein
MPTQTRAHRRPAQRLAVTGVGIGIGIGIGIGTLLVATAPAALAADNVVISLAPTEVGLISYPAENHGGMPTDPMTGPTGDAPEPVVVQYGETLTVDLAAELDPSNAEVEIAFADDADADGVPDRTYSTVSTTDPLVVTVVNDNDLQIVLPTDDGVNGPLATLSISPLDAVLGPEFILVDPTIAYELDLSSTTPTATTLHPGLVAIAQVPCSLISATPCPIAVTAGATLTLDLTADSVLRDLGLTDLTGVQVALQSMDDLTAPPVLLDVEVSGSTATAILPTELAAGPYALVLGQPMTSGLSIVVAELDLAARAVGPPAAAPTTPTTPVAPAVVNAGLRSDTGVEAVQTRSAGTVMIAAGAGMVIVAGVAGVALARSRRRPAAEGGSCA